MRKQNDIDSLITKYREHNGVIEKHHSEMAELIDKLADSGIKRLRLTSEMYLDFETMVTRSVFKDPHNEFVQPPHIRKRGLIFWVWAASGVDWCANYLVDHGFSRRRLEMKATALLETKLKRFR